MADKKQLLESLKDFYDWKAWVNDPTFEQRFFENKEDTLKEVPRSKLYT